MPPRKSRKLDVPSSAMAVEPQTLEEYAAHVNQLCPGMSTTKTILWDLENTTSVLTSRKIDHSIGCTHSDTVTCHIMSDLKLWNEFLWIIHLELKEVVPRKFGIVYQLGFTPRMISGIQRSHASILLHWLLKTHRCIEALELKETLFGVDLHLVSDALLHNAEVKRLGISNFDRVPKAFVTALLTLSALEELELCDVSLTRYALAELHLAFKEMSSLRSLKLDIRKLNPTNASELLVALGDCTATALHISGWCLNNGTVFAEFLARNTTLKELTVDWIIGERERTDELWALFGALSTNKVLEKLYLPYCLLQPSEGWFLAQVMAENSSLHVLQVGVAGWNELSPFAELIERNSSLRELEIRDVYPVAELADCIRKNTTLKKLTIGCVRSTSVEEVETFLDAVAGNESLMLVTLENVFELVPGDFHQLLKQKGLEKRVHYDCYVREPPIHTSNKKGGTSLGRVFFSMGRDLAIDVIHSQYSKLACPHHFVEVSVLLDRLDYATAKLLAAFLTSTISLESLYLSFYTDESCMQVLLEGLGLNKSVSSLAFEDCKFTTENATLLGALVKKSTLIEKITLLFPEYSTSSVVVSELPKSLEDNYSVLSVRTNEYLYLGYYMFKVKDIMRRNGSVLLDAVQFAMGSCTKQHAEAFERHLESKSLVRKLQEFAKETEFEARERIRARLRYLRYNFMTVAGIVKQSVICKQGKQKQTLLDQIGFDNLLRVVSYLKVRDIVNEPVAGCSRAPRSQMQLRKRKAQP